MFKQKQLIVSFIITFKDVNIVYDKVRLKSKTLIIYKVLKQNLIQ